MRTIIKEGDLSKIPFLEGRQKSVKLIENTTPRKPNFFTESKLLRSIRAKNKKNSVRGIFGE